MHSGHTEEFIIRTHEIDRNKKITVPSLLMLMQEASMQNVVNLKISVWDLEAKEISWVLLRKELTIHRLPGLGEKIRILTYPAGFHKVFAYRDFKVYDQNDNLLASAGSTWTLMNMSTRRIQKIPDEFYFLNPPKDQELLKIPASKIDIPEEVSYRSFFKVGYFDLDWNGHVNNIILSKLILQTLPKAYLQFEKLIEYVLHVKSECFFDEGLETQIEIVDEHKTLHRIVSQKDARTIASAICQWK